MEPHTYILDLLYKFNQRTGANYPPSRGYSIMQCYTENKIEYYPRDYNKHDWLIGTICSNYTSMRTDIITLPNIPIYNSSIYAFLVLDYYNVTDYNKLFNVIRYNMNMNSMQIKQLIKSKDLTNLVHELYLNKYKFVGADRIFEALSPGTRKSKNVAYKRKVDDELDIKFKILKLE